MVICDVNLPQKGYIPLIDFTKFCLERESQDYTPTPNLTIVALKMWPYGPRNCQKWYFW